MVPARNTTRHRGLVPASCLLAFVLAACSSSSGPQSTDPEFQGLDPSLVTEVLQNARAQANVEPLAPEDRASMWQGMVGNFRLCRQMLAYYEAWVKQGVRPSSFPTPLEPSHPETSYRDLLSTYAFYKKEAGSGDIARLRGDLLNESGCGVWIPAKPNDVTGQTIADVVGKSG